MSRRARSSGAATRANRAMPGSASAQAGQRRAILGAGRPRETRPRPRPDRIRSTLRSGAGEHPAAQRGCPGAAKAFAEDQPVGSSGEPGLHGQLGGQPRADPLRWCRRTRTTTSAARPVRRKTAGGRRRRWARPCSGTCRWAATRPGLRLVPLPRRRRQPDQEPDQPEHVGGDLTLQLHGGIQNTDLRGRTFPSSGDRRTRRMIPATPSATSTTSRPRWACASASSSTFPTRPRSLQRLSGPARNLCEDTAA